MRWSDLPVNINILITITTWNFKSRLRRFIKLENTSSKYAECDHLRFCIGLIFFMKSGENHQWFDYKFHSGANLCDDQSAIRVVGSKSRFSQSRLSPFASAEGTENALWRKAVVNFMPWQSTTIYLTSQLECNNSWVVEAESVRRIFFLPHASGQGGNPTQIPGPI